jgi:hypothetical protein
MSHLFVPDAWPAIGLVAHAATRRGKPACRIHHRHTCERERIVQAMQKLRIVTVGISGARAAVLRRPLISLYGTRYDCSPFSHVHVSIVQGAFCSPPVPNLSVTIRKFCHR